MKHSLLVLLALALCLTGLPAPNEDVSPMRKVTVQEWMACQGDCGKCFVPVEILEIVNPALAAVGDETGRVNLFGVHFQGNFFGFDENMFRAGDKILLANPRYNVFEGSVEMADAEFLGFSELGGEALPLRVSVQEWLEAKGEVGDCSLTVAVRAYIYPVLAIVTDGSANANLFSFKVDGETMGLLGEAAQVGDVLILQNPVYNVFNGAPEIIEAELLRVIHKPQAE